MNFREKLEKPAIKIGLREQTYGLRTPATQQSIHSQSRQRHLPASSSSSCSLCRCRRVLAQLSLSCTGSNLGPNLSTRPRSGPILGHFCSCCCCREVSSSLLSQTLITTNNISGNKKQVASRLLTIEFILLPETLLTLFIDDGETLSGRHLPFECRWPTSAADHTSSSCNYSTARRYPCRSVGRLVRRAPAHQPTDRRAFDSHGCGRRDLDGRSSC